jgi:hypothetical protein
MKRMGAQHVPRTQRMVCGQEVATLVNSIWLTKRDNVHMLKHQKHCARNALNQIESTTQYHELVGRDEDSQIPLSACRVCINSEYNVTLIYKTQNFNVSSFTNNNFRHARINLQAQKHKNLES